jgi:hypothetical protein
MRLIRIITVFLLIVSLLMIVATFRSLPVTNQFTEVLSWLTLETAPMVVFGTALSYLMEVVPGWGTRIQRAQRQMIVLILCIILGVLAQSLVLNKLSIFTQLKWPFKMIYDILVIWIATQQTFATIKKDEMSSPRA